MKKTLPADSEILQYLYHDGGVRGEKIAMRFRWLLVVLVLALIVVMFLKGQTREASWSLNENLGSMEEQDARRAVRTIHDTNRRGLYLLDNLLNWTRLQTGKLRVHGTVIPVYAVVKNLLDYFEVQSREKNVRIMIDTDPALSLFCDEDMFRTILRNIVSNAMKFTPEGGKVRISGKSGNGSTMVCVEDTGVGKFE